MLGYCKFTMTKGTPVYVNPDYIVGVFENGSSKSETVINLVSGGYYSVTESVQEVIETTGYVLKKSNNVQ